VKTRKEKVSLEKRFKPIVIGTASLAFSPDGKQLAAGCDEPIYGNGVLLWDVETGKVQKPFKGGKAPLDAVVAVAFSPDGTTLAAGCEVGTIKLLDLPTGNIRALLTGHVKDSLLRSLAISPDSKILASRTHDKTIKLWDLGTAKELATLEQPTRQVRPGI
jgi:WD40 repeat protein